MNQLEEAASWQRAWQMLREHGTSAGVKKSWDTRRRGRHPEQPSHEPHNPRDAFSPDDPAIRAGTDAGTKGTLRAVQNAVRRQLDPSDWVTHSRIDKSWNKSADSDTSIALRSTAARLWGGDVWWNGEKVPVDWAFNHAAGDFPSLRPLDETFTTFAKVQYAATQKFLEPQGDMITVYRGVNTEDVPTVGQSVDTKLGALSSFSISRTVAKKFGNVAMKFEIPREYVFSHYAVGPGTEYERELLVLGDERTFKGEVIKGRKQREAQAPPRSISPRVMELDAGDNQNWLRIVAKERQAKSVQILKRIADKLQKLVQR